MVDLVAVEVDLYDDALPGIRTLRLCNLGPVTAERSGVRVQFEPGLITPILLGTGIGSVTFGNAVRAVPNGGTITFAIDGRMWQWLRLHWLGRIFRVYQGSGLDLIYEGRVAGLTHDSNQAVITTTDASFDLNVPLISDLYGPTAAAALVGLPKPQLWGQGVCIEPVLEDEPTQLWRVSRSPLADISRVHIGGVEWNKMTGTPGPGQWAPNLAEGTFTLGGATDGGQVRCDAKAVGWETMATASLLTAIATSFGASTDAASMAALNIAAPGLVGYFTGTNSINAQDAIDEIVAGAGGWWGASDTGEIAAAVIAAPGSPGATLDETDIATLALNSLLQPAWRVRVEYARNWSPVTQFFTAVSDADQQALAATGINVTPYENAAALVAEPQAVDVPIIRSLFANQADAIVMGNRLGAAWGVARRLYDVTFFGDAPALYETLSLAFEAVSGPFRAHSSIRSFGGGPPQIQVWG